MAITVVAQQKEIVTDPERQDLLHLFRRNHGAARVIGRVDDHQLGLRGYQFFDGLRAHRKAFALASLEQDGRASRVIDDVQKGDPVGDREDDLIAVVDGSEYRLEDGLLSSHGHQAFLGLVVRSEVLGVPLDQSALQFADSARGSVLCEIFFERLDGGPLDVSGCRKIRFADAEVHQLHAAGLQVLRLLHCRRG